MKTVKVKILRGVSIAGERIEPGTETEIDRRLGSDLVSCGKAEYCTPVQPEVISEGLGVKKDKKDAK